MQAISKTFSSHKKVGVAEQGNDTELLSAEAGSVQASKAQTAVPLSAPPKETFDVEGGSHQSPVSNNPNVEMMLRHGFLRKVYGILSVQLFVTFGMIFLFQADTMKGTLFKCSDGKPPKFDGPYPPNTCDESAVGCCTDFCAKDGSTCDGPQDKSIFRPQPTSFLTAMNYLGFVVGFAALLMLVCCTKNARTYPRNYVLLGIFTVAEGFMLAAICAFSQMQVILIAAGMTAAITVGLSLFACQTKIDFTGIGGYLYSALLCLIMFGFMMGLFHASVPGLHKLYLFAGVMIFSLYIVYDTQLMLGGNHKLTITYDDYVFAALNLYLDIINLFILLLDMLNGGRD